MKTEAEIREQLKMVQEDWEQAKELKISALGSMAYSVQESTLIWVLGDKK